MSAFDRAAAVLFRNVDMSEPVTFDPAGAGAAVATRAVFREPGEVVQVYGQSLRLDSLSAWLPVSVTPAKGDTITRGADTYTINAAPELNPHRTAWRCSLDPAS